MRYYRALLLLPFLTITVFYTATYRGGPLGGIVLLLFGSLASLAIIWPPPRVASYSKRELPIIPVTLILIPVSALLNMAGPEVASLDPLTIIVAVLSAVGITLFSLTLGWSFLGRKYLDLLGAFTCVVVGYGYLSMVALISMGTGMTWIFYILAVLPIVVRVVKTRSWSTYIWVPSGDHARYMAILLMPLAVASIPAALNVFNPYTDQMLFTLNAIQAEGSIRFYPQPLSSFIPEYSWSKLTGINPWIVGLGTMGLNTLLFLAAILLFMERMNIPLGGLKWILVEGLTTVLLLPAAAQGGWDRTTYVSVAWNSPSGLILLPHRFAFMKDLAIIPSALALYFSPPIAVAIALPYLLFQQPITSLGILVPISLLKGDRRWMRGFLAGGFISTLAYAVVPTKILPDIGNHLIYLPKWILFVSPIAFALLVLGLLKISSKFRRILGKVGEDHLKAITFALVLVSALLPYGAFLPQADITSWEGRVLSSISSLKFMALPWLIWYWKSKRRGSAETRFLALTTLAMILLPFIFYEPLRLIAILSFTLLLPTASTHEERLLALVLIFLSLPLGTVAFVSDDNIQYEMRMDEYLAIPEEAIVMERPYIVYSVVLGKKVFPVQMKRSLTYALLMSPDPAFVSLFLPEKREVYMPEILTNAEYSFISYRGGTYFGQECLRIPEKISIPFLHELWRAAPRCYILPWGKVEPEVGHMAAALRVVNGEVVFANRSVRVRDAVIYPSLGYAYMVGEFDAPRQDFDLDPATISPYSPYLWYPSSPNIGGVKLRASIFRPYTLTRYPLNESLELREYRPFIQIRSMEKERIQDASEDIWIKGTKVNIPELRERENWLFIWNWVSDDRRAGGIFPLIYYRNRNVTVIPLPAKVVGKVKAYVMWAFGSPFMLENFQEQGYFYNPEIVYASGNLLILRSEGWEYTSPPS